MKEKNLSNLTKTLAVVSLLAPATAQPLGIGDIELHSVLNQKLNAVIKLHLAGENPSDITVRLAPPEKFDQAGVPWNYSLAKLKFDPVVKPDGSMSIKVTSHDAFVEPFLNFLLEVSWPQGSLVREFTLLVDPPSEYGNPNLSVVAESVEDGKLSAVSERRASKPRSSRPSIRNTAPVITPSSPTSGEYGPIQSKDTLWRIAENLAVKQGVNTNLMMNALHQANPQAFIQGNIDLLKVGAVLKVPDTQAMAHGSTAQQRTNSVAPGIGKRAELQLVPPTDVNVPESSELGGRVKPQPGAGGAESASGSQVSGKDSELQGRIEKLEEQLRMMQQLVALKDQQLANLQNKDKSPSIQQPVEQPSVGVTTTSVPVSQQPTNVEPLLQQPVATAQPTLAPVPTATQKPAPSPIPQPTEEGEISTYLIGVGALGLAAATLLGGLWWRKRKIDERTTSESMFASASQIKMPDSDSALSVPPVDITNATTYDVGTVGESSFISDFTPSDFDAFDAEQSEVDPLSEADVYLAYGRYQQAEDLIRHAIHDAPDRDDYKLKLLEILYANENKQAFGNYAQELADNGKQLDRIFWNKVSDMGKEIAAEHVLFGGQAVFDKAKGSEHLEASKPRAEFAVDSGQDTVLDEGVDDIFNLHDEGIPDLDLHSDFSADLAELELNSDQQTVGGRALDFDFAAMSDLSLTEDQQLTAADEQDQTGSIEFDLEGVRPETAKPESVGTNQAEETLESFDFSFDFDSSESISKKGNGSPEANSIELETLEFPGFDVNAEKVGAESTAPIETSAPNSSSAGGEFDFKFDFDTPSSLVDDAESSDLGVFDLTDMDEFETKIDLAKAYIDMGDIEVAKKIAAEVLEKGSKEQKQQAQAILDEL